MKNLLLLLFLILASCKTNYSVVENDDLYFSKRNRDSVVVKYRYKNRYIYTPSPTPFYNPYNSWGQSVPMWNYHYRYNRPNVVIIKPEYRIEKRPNREGNGGVSVPLNRRRGRD